jgi:hypothetical protein
VYQPTGLYGPAGGPRRVRDSRPSGVRASDLQRVPGSDLVAGVTSSAVGSVTRSIRNVRQALSKEAPEPVLGAPGA